GRRGERAGGRGRTGAGGPSRRRSLGVTPASTPGTAPPAPGTVCAAGRPRGGTPPRGVLNPEVPPDLGTARRRTAGEVAPGCQMGTHHQFFSRHSASFRPAAGGRVLLC